MAVATTASRIRVAISSSVYGEAVPNGSPSHLEARLLQAERFAKVSMPDASGSMTYSQATDNAADYSIPIVVKRSAVSVPGKVAPFPDQLIAAARLDLHGGMLVESMIRLVPQSASEIALISGKVGEISTFATLPGIERSLMPDIVDAIIGVALQLAEALGLDRLWIFPRNGFMSLLWASIPEMLPGYRFSLCPDILGWNEDSVRLQQFRALKLRGLTDFPEIYQIDRASLKADWDARQALIAIRHANRVALDRMLLSAILQARKRNRASGVPPTETSDASLPSSLLAANGHSTLPAHPQGQNHRQNHGQNHGQSFLPFDASTSDPGDYLHAVLQRGGASAAEYKQMSYALLDAHAGMRVLDVGCGVGVDLLPLVNFVGETGAVVGLDHSPDLLDRARRSAAVREHANVLVFQGDAHQMGFPNETFDRVRADRVIQHCQRPAQVIREMWRVLRPGGILTIVEPDWKSIALYPASALGGDDDTTLSRLFGWYARNLAHPLIGRQLRASLSQDGTLAWSAASVEAVAFSFTDWHAVDAVLQVTNAAHALGAEDVASRDELARWLTSLEQASANGQFYAMVPLFFAYARKSTPV